MTTKREACEKWVQRDFSSIPYALIERAYLDNEQFGEDIEILAPTPDHWAERYYEDYLEPTKDFVSFGEWQKLYLDLYDYDDPDGLEWAKEDYQDELETHQRDSESAIEEAKEMARDCGYHENIGPIPMWGTLFVPGGWDQDWCRDNAEAVSRCGFIVYETDEIGVYLGINGAGYDFYEAHWMVLYDLRGLQWHDEEAKDV